MDVRDAKQYRCLHAFSQHAKRQADMQAWQPEMQKKTTYYHVLPHTTTYYHVLPRTITYCYKRSFCISGSHPCMSASQFPFSFTELLFTNLLPY